MTVMQIRKCLTEIVLVFDLVPEQLDLQRWRYEHLVAQEGLVGDHLEQVRIEYRL